MGRSIPSTKKILIVTMHRGFNYGSALQAYALSEVLKNKGLEPTLLDYLPKRLHLNVLLCSIFRNICGFRSSIVERYTAIRDLIILLINLRNFNPFFKKNISMTRCFKSFDQICHSCPKADVYLTGSDQVWNSSYNNGIDKTFFLDFVPQNSKRVAYAASFGKLRLDEWEIKETKELLSKYSAISVRESSGLTILQTLGIHSCAHVLDPTFLLSKDEWLKRCPLTCKKEKYVLIYSVEPNRDQLIDYAYQIATMLKAKVYLIDFGMKRPLHVDRMVFNISPLLLMTYFINADFIVASSFHGTAFSINLGKQFISVLPDKFNSRASSLLNLLGLTSRIVTKNEQFKIDRALSPINYSAVNKILEKEKSNSLQYLFNSI